MNILASSFTTGELVVFCVLVVFFLVLDIKTGSPDKPVSMTKAAVWSVIWVVVSLAFAGYVAWDAGTADAVKFVTAYFLEKTLAVDNLFVFMAIFGSFSIPDKYHHRILHWGIIGALVFRAIFIGLGVGLLGGAKRINQFMLAGISIDPVTIVFFIFGAVVLWSAVSLLKNVTTRNEDLEEEEIDYSDHWSVRFLRKLLPDQISTQLDGHNFFTTVVNSATNRRVLAVTPLFLCLIVIEASDIMFAFDSVPAIFAVTQETYLVYTSNIFAVLGLRSMYFLVAAAKRYLCHLEKAVIIILAYIGVKMMALGWVHIPPMVSLGVVLGFLALGIVASVLWPEEEEAVGA